MRLASRASDWLVIFLNMHAVPGEAESWLDSLVLNSSYLCARDHLLVEETALRCQPTSQRCASRLWCSYGALQLL
jgi:hypothetical protein